MHQLLPIFSETKGSIATSNVGKSKKTGSGDTKNKIYTLVMKWPISTIKTVRQN